MTNSHSIQKKTLDEIRQKAEACNTLGVECHKLQDSKKARTYFSDAIDLIRKDISSSNRTEKDKFNLARYLCNKGNASIQEGKLSWDEIVVFYIDAGELFESLLLKNSQELKKCKMTDDNDVYIRKTAFCFFRIAKGYESVDQKKQIEFLDRGVKMLGKLCDQTTKDKEDLKTYSGKLAVLQAPQKNWFLNDKGSNSQGSQESSQAKEVVISNKISNKTGK